MGATGTVPGATTGARHDGNGRRPAAERVVSPRRGLPQGRAVVGGLLVALAAVGIFAAWQAGQDGPATSYAVATRDLRPGELLRADDVELRPAQLPASVASAAYVDAAPLEGAVTLGPIAAGELVERGEVAEGGPRAPAHELSFPVPVDRALGGRLLAGERITVLATFGSGAAATTKVVADRALVLGVDEAGGGVDGDSVVLTVALESPDDVVALAHATRAGEVTVVRSVGGAAPLTGAGRTGSGG